MKILFLPFLLVAFLSVSYSSDDVGSFLGELKMAAKQLPPDVIPEVQIQIAKESLRKSGSLDAAIIMWKAYKWPEVELAWWKSKNPHTRMVVVSLFYSQFEDRDFEFFPKFRQEAERFDKAERAERIAEVMHIENNIDEIRKILSTRRHNSN